MALKCYFQFDNGRFCKKFAMNGSRFCNNHQPRGAASDGQYDPHGWPQLHPHLRLANPNDLFDLVRETLHATRTGAVTPSQAFAISSLCTVWLRVYEGMLGHQRLQALNRQILPSMVDMETAEAVEREARLAADAEHRAATEPASLDRRNPWAAGEMAGPAPDAHRSNGAVGHGFRAVCVPDASAGSHATKDGASAPTLLAQADESSGHGFRAVCVPDASAGSRAENSGAQALASLPEADAESAAVGQTQHHPSNNDEETVSAARQQPINLREAQAKLEALLAAQGAGKAPAKPNGGTL